MKLFPGTREGPRASLRRRQWGQAMAEFALVLSALLLIIFLVIEAAMVVQGYLAVEHAAREAVRWAITYQPVQGERLDGGTCMNPYADPPFIYPPYDPAGPGNDCDPTEDTEEYNERRVAIIKEIALQRAAGLRINWNALGLTEATFQANLDEPGFFGVRVWGFPAFNAAEELDHPGLPGLPVRVQVVHNVPILDPLFRAIAPYVRVEAHAEMLNEGIQVGFGNVPPPTFNPPPTFVVSPEGTVPTETGEPTGLPTPSPTPINYQVDIAFDFVVNELPVGRGHPVTVTVTDEQGTPMPGEMVSFSTDFGAYDYSGVSPTYVEAPTDGNGRAISTIYANRPGTAHLTAWIDLDGDNHRDAGEPYDTAEKEWVSSGPYIVASSHRVLPLDTIAVSLYNHPTDQDPFMLLWCRTSITGGISSAVLDTGIYVDSTGAAIDLPEEIPEGSLGYYRLESHTGTGSCGSEATLVAYSADILVEAVPPDLHVLSISYPEEFGDLLPSNTEITFTIVVENLAPTAVEGELFDVDLYIDPANPPPFAGQMGEDKQWLTDIAPYGTGTVTTFLTLAPGTHELWGQVDTTGYIEESDEDNNVSGPFVVNVECTALSSPYGDDFNDGVVDSKWTAAQIGSPNVYGSVSEGNGRLTVNARGRRIWGNGSNENFYFVYQTISGDFDARLRILDAPNISYWSKLGLMVRNSTASNSRHVMLMYTHNHSRLQFAYREEDGGNTYRLSGTSNDIPAPLPVWVRIVRSGNAFGFYYATVEEPGPADWTFQGSKAVAMDDAVLVGIAHATYNTGRNDTGEVDEFVICQASQVSAPSTCYPGLVECTQLLESGGFEGNPQTVFAHWQAGGTGAYQRTGYLQYEGAFSMRLHASLGEYPCQENSYDPYLYQTVQIPADVISTSHLIVEGFHAVGGSLSPCSYPDSPDADDVLYLQIRDGNGQPITGSVSLVNGGADMERWQYFNVDFTNGIDWSAFAGQDVQVYFYATHDQDFYGTFFYLDALECNTCKFCPIPDDEPGTASFGGLVRTILSGVPQPLVGVDVWAYTQGGEVYHTRSIHDGTYHFYNVPPGTYYIYAEAWVGGELRVDTTTTTVVVNERDYTVDLLLQ